MPTIVTKPVEFFHPDPSNPRSNNFQDDELRSLGESLKKKQLVPLIAREDGLTFDGHRRWMAAKLVGVETLDTYLLPMNTTPGAVKGIQLITALHRADLKPYEAYCGFVEWMKAHPGATGKDLAAAIDRSEASVSMTLSLSKCIQPVKDAAAQGKIGLKDWYAISQGDEEQQAAMLAAKLNGTSADGLKRMRKKSTDTVRVARVKCAMPSGVTVTLAGNGDGLTLDDVIKTLTELLKEVHDANKRGLSSKTFSAALKDKAQKVG